MFWDNKITEGRLLTGAILASALGLIFALLYLFGPLQATTASEPFFSAVFLLAIGFTLGAGVHSFVWYLQFRKHGDVNTSKFRLSNNLFSTAFFVGLYVSYAVLFLRDPSIWYQLLAISMSLHGVFTTPIMLGYGFFSDNMYLALSSWLSVGLSFPMFIVILSLVVNFVRFIKNKKPWK